jgi:hypothetical protein
MRAPSGAKYPSGMRIMNTATTAAASDARAMMRKYMNCFASRSFFLR